MGMPDNLKGILSKIYHETTHQSRNEPTTILNKHCLRNFSIISDSFLICNQHNLENTVKVGYGPELCRKRYSDNLQMDFIPLLSPVGYVCVIIIVCFFCGWVEAFLWCKPRFHHGQNTIRFVGPTWDLPTYPSRDRGIHFTGIVSCKLCKVFIFSQNLCCPYCLQSSGKIERANEMLKRKVANHL